MNSEWQYLIDATGWILIGAYLGLVFRHVEESVKHERERQTWKH